MRAAIYVATGEPLSVEDVSWLPPGDQDVVVRITASGVCRSDLSMKNGHVPMPPPMVLGHEGVGIVEEVGRSVRGLEVGDRVIGSFVPACGTCWFCAQGESYHCDGRADITGVPRLRRHDGSQARLACGLGTFSDYSTVNQASLVKVETDLPDEQLALIGCGVTTGVGAVINTAEVTPGSTVAVIGCGAVGLSVVQGAKIAGASQIVAIDGLADKRELALKLGATVALDPADDAVDQVRALTGGRGVDYAFDVVGRPETISSAWQLSRRSGTVTLVGVPGVKDMLPVPLVSLLVDGKRLLGSLYGSARVRRDFPVLVGLAEAGRLDLGSLVTRVIGLDAVNEAMADLEAGTQVRSVIVP